MAKAKSVKLTFAITLEQPKGVTLPEMRAYILHSLKYGKDRYKDSNIDLSELNLDNVKCHLTNKEVHYG